MPWSEEISQLITDVDQLNTAVNAQKTLLNSAVILAEASKNSTNTSAIAAAASAIVADTNTQAANTHKNSTLNIYGNLSAQRAGLGIAQTAANASATSAIIARTGLVQDLSGVSATALHRSPNAITSMFVYDTSKDSDGGAWTEKCQSTSWYNEPLMGKWLGSHDLENSARFTNAISGNELLTNGSFLNGLTGWTTTGATVNVSGNVAYISALSNNVRQSISQTFPTVIGVTYRLTYRLVSGGGGNTHVYVGNSYASGELGSGQVLVGNRTVIFTASATTTFLTIGVWGILETLAVTDVSLRQVISTTTASGDYYQLTTDGKFYRMRRNKFTFTESFVAGNYNFPQPALGGINGTLAGTTFTASTRFGNISMCNVTSTAGTAEHGIYVCTNNFGVSGENWPGMPNATFSCIIKRGTSDYIILRQYSSTPFVEAKFNLNTLAITKTSNFASIEDLGGGLFRLSISHSYIGGGRQNWHIKGTDATGNATFNGDGTVMFAVSALQLESGDAPTDYEAVLGINEIFRGNKADFPRLAGIVAEGANINIYDLTEPGRPMWMRFTTGTSTILGWYSTTPNVNGISALNGTITVALSQGGVLLQFPRDDMRLMAASTISADVVNRSIAARRATGATRSTNNTTTYDSFAVGNLIQNATAMVVLPDAPTDPVTGLKIPTIAITTDSGISIIKHNGTVVNSTATPLSSLTLTPDVVTGSRGYSNADHYIAFKPGSLSAGFSFISSYGNQFDNLGSTTKMIAPNRSTYLKSNSNRIGIRRLNDTMGLAGRHLSAVIAPNYNTGWLAGDIRRTYLSDTDVGSISRTDLVTNGTFSANTTGWTTYGSGTASTIAAVDGVAQWTVLAGASYPGVSTQISGLTIGKTYRISWLYSRTSGGDTSEFRVATANSLGGGLIASVSNPATGVLGNIQFVATTTSVFIGQFLIANPTTGSVHTFDNVSAYEVIADRSYKAQVANITGSLVKSQVASGASLVGYSGWSTANYLREPYLTDLDFGTSEWNVSAWVNTISPPKRNLLTWTDSFNPLGWTATYQGLGATPIVTLNYAVAPDGTNTATRLQCSRTATGGADRSRLQQVVTYPLGAILSRSIWVKSATGTSQVIEITDSSENNSINTVTVGSEWQRITITYNALLIANGNVWIGLLSAATPALTTDVLIWGAQLEISSVVTPYQRVFAAYDVNDSVDIPLGPELLTNGDFTNGSTGWTTDANVSMSYAGGQFSITAINVGSYLIKGVIPTITIGKTYSISIDIISSAVNTVRVDAFGTLMQFAAGNIGTRIFKVVATTQDFRIAFYGNCVATIDNISIKEVIPFSIVNRSYTSGTALRLMMMPAGILVAEAFDGTTTRTITTTSAYNTGQWLKADVNYTTDGTLAIAVNGREVAATRGTPLGNMTFGKNLLPYSNTLTTWSKANATVTNPNIIAPDGTTQTVSLYKDSIGTTEQRVSYDIGVAYATQVITVSVYVKRIDSDYFSIQISEEFNYQNLRAAFNITDAGYGLVNTFGTVTTSITPAGNGWFRITISGQSNNNNNTKIFFTLSSSVSGTSRVYAYNYTATGKSVYIYGAQAEVGSSATSFAATNIATLTIGNNFDTNAPFPGSIALLKLGTTVPTPEQAVFMYEQEKQLFRPGAQSILPDTNAIIDMSYDDATDRWAAISTTNESYWSGLVRNSVTSVPAGSYSKITTNSGVELVSRISTNPGVDVSIPPYALREELVKRAESANKLVNKLSVYDYVGGFTGNITTGSTSILSVTALTYPTSYIGARISGTGIPANTFITGVSGTTIYISAAASATTTGATITFFDFILPVGMEAKIVMSAGVIRREGPTFDYTRIYDGFKEVIRFSTAPGATAWVQIQAKRIL